MSNRLLTSSGGRPILQGRHVHQGLSVEESKHPVIWSIVVGKDNYTLRNPDFPFALIGRNNVGLPAYFESNKKLPVPVGSDPFMGHSVSLNPC